MYGLAQQPWGVSVDLATYSQLYLIRDPTDKVALYTEAIPRLTVEFAVRALLQLTVLMATEQEFHAVDGHIFRLQQEVGRIFFIPTDQIPSDLPLLSGGSANVTINGTSANLSQASTGSAPTDTNLMALSGEIHDPEDERITITYSYNFVDISAQDVLSAIIDGLATVAQYPSDVSRPWITGGSARLNAYIQISREEGEVLLGWHISRTFHLLATKLFLVQQRYAAVVFELHFYGTLIASGKVGSLKGLEGAGITYATASH